METQIDNKIALLIDTDKVQAELIINILAVDNGSSFFVNLKNLK
jgi:hypothetical protein